MVPPGLFTGTSGCESTLLEVGVGMTNASTKKSTAKNAPAGYSGTPLPKKLGIKDGTVLTLLNAPSGFRETLGELPASVKTNSRISRATTLIIWFVDRRAVFSKRLSSVSKALAQGSIWIAWPKKASGVETDLSESVVRDSGLSVGLVDYKVCAIDNTWSGLLFTHRKSR